MHQPPLCDALDETKGPAGNPWSLSIRRIFDMAKADVVSMCKRAPEDGHLPMYEAKVMHQFDHRWATYEADGESAREATKGEKERADFEPMPRYWVPEREVENRLRGKGWNRAWFMGWRDITNATNERTAIAAVLPPRGTDFTIRVNIGSYRDWLPFDALLANFNSLVLDFLARQKIGGTHLADFVTKQLPVLPPSYYDVKASDFIVPRVLELTYTSHAMRPFAEDLGYQGPPFPWDENRRALLRAELDAYYARLYALTRDELRYILDPADVYGEDYPSETFRVLKKNEIREFGEYRTRRLVLAAWDRLEAKTLDWAAA